MNNAKIYDVGVLAHEKLAFLTSTTNHKLRHIVGHINLIDSITAKLNKELLSQSIPKPCRPTLPRKNQAKYVSRLDSIQQPVVYVTEQFSVKEIDIFDDDEDDDNVDDEVDSDDEYAEHRRHGAPTEIAMEPPHKNRALRLTISKMDSIGEDGSGVECYEFASEEDSDDSDDETNSRDTSKSNYLPLNITAVSRSY